MVIYYTHEYKKLGIPSHELLELAISDYIGDEKRAGELVSNLEREKKGAYDGKPYIPGFDKFSISHSDCSWAVLISDRECGLDIQYERNSDYRSIADRFFHPEDAEAVKNPRDFFELWTRREAFVKAIGSSVFYEDYPPLMMHSGISYDERHYYLSNISFPAEDGLYAAICLDAEKPIDETLDYKEIKHVRE